MSRFHSVLLVLQWKEPFRTLLLPPLRIDVIINCFLIFYFDSGSTQPTRMMLSAGEWQLLTRNLGQRPTTLWCWLHGFRFFFFLFSFCGTENHHPAGIFVPAPVRAISRGTCRFINAEDIRGRGRGSRGDHCHPLLCCYGKEALAIEGRSK